MKADQIRAHILTAIGELAPEADLASIEDDRPLREQFDLDSYDYLQLMVRLHELLGVEIPERDYVDIASLAQLVRYVEARMAEPPTPG